MPLCELHLLALSKDTSIAAFIAALRSHDIKPIIQSKVMRWIILPSKLSTGPLLAHNNHWDILIILPHATQWPDKIKKQITCNWQVSAGVPSSRLTNFASKNASLLNPAAGSVKPPDMATQISTIAEGSQSLELSHELQSWITNTLLYPHHAVSMFNLLAFSPGKKAQYAQYGAEFAKHVGSKYGGDAKIVGNVIGGQGKDEGWDEIAYVHYPSIEHFCAMIGSSEYQEVNRKYRLGSLKDTCILFTMEIDDDGNLVGKAPFGRSKI